MNLKIKQILKKQKTLILINLIKNKYQYSSTHSYSPSPSELRSLLHNLFLMLLNLSCFTKFSSFHTFSSYQCTNVLLAYIKSNLWSILENTSAIKVLFEILQTALITLAKSPPGETVGGW